MKKLFIASLLVAASSMAFAANTGDWAAGSNTVTDTDCTLLNAGSSLKVILSTSNVGSYNCDTTSANIGVAVANTSGKNIVFSMGSSGGGIIVTNTGTTAPSATNTATAAATAASSS